MLSRIILLLLLVSMLSCKKKDPVPAPKEIPYPEGMSTNYLTVNSVNRKYLVY